MSIYNVSISHKTAPASIRALLAFDQEEKIDFIKSAIQLEHIFECVLINTCNRSEVYINGDEMALEELMTHLTKKKGLDHEKMLKYYRIYQDQKAVEHLFRVASGIDSMLIGEDEILGQVKDSYQLALEQGTTSTLLNTLFRDAITCAKKVKTKTKLSKTSVSLGTLAAHAVFHFKKCDNKKKVFIIGLTGKMGTILMKNLYQNPEVEIMGTIRTHRAPEELVVSYPKVKMVQYLDRYDYMDDADIIISATTSPHYTITKDELQNHLQQTKYRLFIDLAVPMDIDKEITKLEHVELYDIDFFTKLSEQNNMLKLQEVEVAKMIIEEEVDEFQKWCHFQEFVPLLPEVKNIILNKGFEKVMYQIRNSAKSEELEVILSSFKDLLKEQW